MEKAIEKLTANYDARMEAIKAAKLEEAQKLLADKARKVGDSSRHTCHALLRTLSSMVTTVWLVRSRAGE